MLLEGEDGGNKKTWTLSSCGRGRDGVWWKVVDECVTLKELGSVVVMELLRVVLVFLLSLFVLLVLFLVLLLLLSKLLLLLLLLFKLLSLLLLLLSELLLLLLLLVFLKFHSAVTRSTGYGNLAHFELAFRKGRLPFLPCDAVVGGVLVCVVVVDFAVIAIGFILFVAIVVVAIVVVAVVVVAVVVAVVAVVVVVVVVKVTDVVTLAKGDLKNWV